MTQDLLYHTQQLQLQHLGSTVVPVLHTWTRQFKKLICSRKTNFMQERRKSKMVTSSLIPRVNKNGSGDWVNVLNKKKGDKKKQFILPSIPFLASSIPYFKLHCRRILQGNCLWQKWSSNRNLKLKYNTYTYITIYIYWIIIDKSKYI